MQTTTVKIPEQNVGIFLDKFEKFEKRAKKSGATIACERLYRSTRHFTTGDQFGFPVQHTARYEAFEIAAPDQINIQGWTLLGAIDRTHSNPVFYNAPESAIPPSYRDSDGTCDHCNTNRRRKETFVLQHDDERVMQVGRNCLADFIADGDVKEILATYEWLQRAARLFGCDDDDDIGYSTGVEDCTPLMQFLPMVSRCIRQAGWVSGSRARAYNATLDEDSSAGLTSTRNYALEQLTPLQSYEKRNGVVRLRPEAEDYDVANAAIVWAAGLTEDNDYQNNIRTIARDNWFRARESGLAASIVGSHLRELDWQEKTRREVERTADAEPVPVTGERILITGVVVKVAVQENDFGSREVMTVEDERGFRIWGSVPSSLDVEEIKNKRITFTAKVTRSDSDPKFGFFKRPTKAEMIL
jgi:hypothetical protein